MSEYASDRILKDLPKTPQSPWSLKTECKFISRDLEKCLDRLNETKNPPVRKAFEISLKSIVVVKPKPRRWPRVPEIIGPRTTDDFSRWFHEFTADFLEIIYVGRDGGLDGVKRIGATGLLNLRDAKFRTWRAKRTVAEESRESHRRSTMHTDFRGQWTIDYPWEGGGCWHPRRSGLKIALTRSRGLVYALGD